MLTTILDLLGIVLLIAFAVVVWAPLGLLVAGMAALAASWRLAGGHVRLGRRNRREGAS